jgi:glycosyl transferase family 25
MIKSYLINLDRNKDRLNFFISNFKKIGLEFTRISGIDGSKFSKEEFDNFSKIRPRRNIPWLPGQMGCFLSHYHAWGKIATGTERFCAVFEDDIHISTDLKNILDNDQWIPDDFDIIRLETSTNRILLTKNPVLKYGNRKIYGVKSTSWCAGGYILSRSAAQKLINLPIEAHDSSDALLYNFENSAIANKLNIFQFNPAPCTQDKYLLSGSIKFKSNIESPLSNPLKIKEKIKKISPLIIITGIAKSIKGYKRITFM